MTFYGRSQELQQLQVVTARASAACIVLRGRRRIGKSRLAAEYGKSFKTYTFSGLAPDPNQKITAQMQRKEFLRQIVRETGLRGLAADDWGDLFWHLAQHIKQSDQKTLIILDEINWMGSLDPTFLSKLKIAWDEYFKNIPQFFMILSGSMSAWIERNILGSTGFMGRISLDLVLEELPLPVCNEFWGDFKEYISAYEKFKILSVIGGIPRYLEEINPKLSAEDNIQNLAFTKGELLVEDFHRIFSDLFSKRSEKYQWIVRALLGGAATLTEISEKIKLEKGGQLSGYVQDLVETGFVSREYSWKLHNGHLSKLSHYRLKDNYVRFYLKYIEPNKPKIITEGSIKLPAWHSIMGLQFENLVINNRQLLYRTLNINIDDVLTANPYYQRQTNRQAGCQIDFLIQTQFNNLIACEIKFSRDKVGLSVIDEVAEKIERLHTPHNFSVRPVLIVVNGVTDAVIDSGFFANIVHFSNFLQGS